MKIAKFIALSLLLGSALCHAQNNGIDYTNYMQCADEALANGDYGAAVHFFESALEENPENVAALVQLSAIRASRYYEEYAKALAEAEKALKLLPRKDKDNRPYALRTCSRCHLALGDTAKALDAINKALALLPDYISLWEDRCDIYHRLGRYDKAEADARRMVEMDPGATEGHLALGAIAMDVKEYAKAVEHYTRAISIDNSVSNGYEWRGVAYCHLGDLEKAADDYISAYRTARNSCPVYLFDELKSRDIKPLITELKALERRDAGKTSYWTYMLCDVYHRCDDLEQTVECAKRLLSDADYVRYATDALAVIHLELYDYETALFYAEQVEELDPMSSHSLFINLRVLAGLGQFDEALDVADDLISSFGAEEWNHWWRAYVRELAGDDAGAIEDLNAQCDVYASPVSYCMRGRIYHRIGNKELAMEDFRKAAAERSFVDEDFDYDWACAQAYLGNMDAAKAEIEKGMSGEPNILAQVAALQSQMGNVEEAMSTLRKALEEGYANFEYLQRHPSLKPLRETDGFEAMVAEFKAKSEAKRAERKAKNPDYVVSSMQEEFEVPYELKNGLYEFQCKVGGLPLTIAYDPKATRATIASVDATFLCKNGYVGRADVRDARSHMDSDGKLTNGYVIALRNVEVGDTAVESLRATVVSDQKASIVVGDSSLSRLGRLSLDKDRKVIRFTKTLFK